MTTSQHCDAFTSLFILLFFGYGIVVTRVCVTRLSNIGRSSFSIVDKTLVDILMSCSLRITEKSHLTLLKSSCQIVNHRVFPLGVQIII